MSAHKKLLIAVVFWGPWHRDAFIEVELPSLLSTNNLPPLARAHDITFRILTTRSDRLVLEAARAFARLKECARVEVIEGGDFSAERRFPIHHHFWDDCIAQARRFGTLLFLLPPDLCFSDGSITEIVLRLNAGKAAVYVTGIRVVSETFIPDVRREYFPANGPWRDIDSEALARLTIAHSHPFNNALQNHSPHTPYISEMTLYPVGSYGWIKHCFIAGPIMFFDPARAETNHNQVVTKVHAAGDFDVIFDDREAAFVSLAPLNLYGDWYIGEGRESDFRKAARRTLRHQSLSSAGVAKELFRIGGEASERSSALWLASENKARAQAARICTLASMLELARGCQRAGLTVFAELVGLLSVCGNALPGLAEDTSYVCVAPTDSVETRLRIQQLVGQSGLAAAAAYVGEHVFVRPPASASQSHDMAGNAAIVRVIGNTAFIGARSYALAGTASNFDIYRASEGII